MKIVPVSKQHLEGGSTLAGLFSGEREKKWPQGWSSGEDHLRMDMAELAERAAQENLREYTCQIQARWPVQGWCKEDHPNKAVTLCKAGGHKAGRHELQSTRIRALHSCVSTKIM